MKALKIAVVGVCAAAVGFATAPDPTTFASTTLAPKSGSSATGTVDFSKSAYGILVRIDLSNVSPGWHGLHVHDKGDCSAKDAASAGDHFNPTGRHHGGPSAVDRHVGDFGNVEAGTDGRVRAELRFGNVTDFDWHDFVGRSLVLHEKADDLTSQPSGNSGKRIACGVIRATQARAAR